MHWRRRSRPSRERSRRLAILRKSPGTIRLSKRGDWSTSCCRPSNPDALRAAVRDASGAWSAVQWVKRGVLAAFRLGVLVDQSPRDGTGRRVEPFTFFDKDTLPPRNFSLADGVRLVPGGSVVRRGAHLARGVICMPPSYVNVAAYVGRDTLIDSHALVGSCAQIGERVHLSAGVQIGGVLEPINAAPVIVEDNVSRGRQQRGLRRRDRTGRGGAGGRCCAHTWDAGLRPRA